MDLQFSNSHVKATIIIGSWIKAPKDMPLQGLQKLCSPKVFHIQKLQTDLSFLCFILKNLKNNLRRCYIKSFTFPDPKSKHTYIPQGSVRKWHIQSVSPHAVTFSQFSKYRICSFLVRNTLTLKSCQTLQKDNKKNTR